MRIAGIQKSSFIDFPGMISIVIFLQGCNYTCYFCHNKCILKGTELIDEDNVFEFLYKRKNLIDAVVITGGEPTIHDDLVSFIKQIKLMGYKIKLDTNGSNKSKVAEIINKRLVDYIAIDYKVPGYLYTQITGYSAHEVLNAIKYVANSGIDYEVRTTMIPEIGFTEIKDMACELPVLKRYILQPYIVDGRALNKDMLINMAQKIKNLQANVSVRN